jgi:hypothetical protein
MKISIMRNDIILRVVDVKGETARIGNAPECEIFIDDPYLSPHVANVMLKDGVWRIVDAGGLKGIRSPAGPVDDEPVADGVTYSVGSFDLIPHLSNVVGPLRPPPPSFNIPGTIMGSLNDLGVTRDRAAYDRGPDAPATIHSNVSPRHEFASGFQSVASTPAEAPAAPSPRPRRLLVVAGVMAAAILALLFIAILREDPKPLPTASTTSSQEAATPARKPPDADEETRSGERALAALDYEKGLKHWESALGLSHDPKLQRRYALVAIDVGRALIARGDTARGLTYLQKAVALGPPGDESVAAVKRELEERPAIP